MPFSIRTCVLASGKQSTAELALIWLKLHKDRRDRSTFFCVECGGRLIVRAKPEPHFVHARSTINDPQPEFCRLRTGGRTKKPPKRIIIEG